MKILSWNCRGLGNPQTVQILDVLIKEKKPDLVFLMETKLSYTKASRISKRFRFQGSVVVEAVGRGGGLMLMWKEESLAELINYSQHHINVSIWDESISKRWLLTCFYGHPVSSLRDKTWSLLASFKPADGGWGVIGDFNEVLFSDEKEGGKARSELLMRQFRGVMEEGRLCDLGWVGNKFTWNNCHEDESFTKERLDRAIANVEWKSLYPVHSVETLPAICSDHSPILLNFSIERCSFQRWHHSFKYEANWNFEEGCSEIVAEAWNKQMGERSRMEVLMGKLESTQRKLSPWSRNLNRERMEAIKVKTHQLELLQRNAGPKNAREQKKLQVDLNLLLNQEDIKWKQRAKRHWLVEGDRNTKFYHA
ncbi:uncharacterized protein LOC122291063 [Carya illinoinensis]|uniref:uncharacterized protein LOC122291063 n=1 Tax=Carya illinoinensis TaxID=32201 RepID=UPI001C719134|nr:uncharacterized protein LOC122291063 [Carya illinoinensis]